MVNVYLYLFIPRRVIKIHCYKEVQRQKIANYWYYVLCFLNNKFIENIYRMLRTTLSGGIEDLIFEFNTNILLVIDSFEIS